MFKSALAVIALTAGAVFADPAQIHTVKVEKTGNAYNFSVTILHTDKGWDDYADAWRVKDQDGNILGTRKLAHPHVEEQPFTRSLSGLKIPGGISSVVIEAHDTVTGWAAKTKTVQLP